MCDSLSCFPLPQIVLDLLFTFYLCISVYHMYAESMEARRGVRSLGLTLQAAVSCQASAGS